MVPSSANTNPKAPRPGLLTSSLELRRVLGLEFGFRVVGLGAFTISHCDSDYGLGRPDSSAQPGFRVQGGVTLPHRDTSFFRCGIKHGRVRLEFLSPTPTTAKPELPNPKPQDSKADTHSKRSRSRSPNPKPPPPYSTPLVV